MTMNRTIWGIVCLSIAASIWGGVYVVSKYVLDFIPPFTLLWLRYCIAVVTLGIVMIAMGQHRIDWKDWKLFAGVGFVGYFVSVGTQFIGTKLSDAHTGSLITATSPIFALLLARLMLKEPLTLRKLIALLVSFVGMVIVIGWNSTGKESLTGNLVLIVASVTWALLSVMAKQASERYSALTVTTYALLLAVLFTTPAMLWEWNTTPNIPVFWQDAYLFWGVLYLGIISTAVAFFLWNKGMELMDAGAGSFFIFVQPVVGSLLGWLLLNEQITVNFFIGGILIASGVWIVTTIRQPARLAE